MTAPRIPRATMRHAAAWPEPFEHDSIAPVQPYKPAAMDYMAGYEDCRRLYRHGWRTGAWQGALAGGALVMLIVEGARWLS